MAGTREAPAKLNREASRLGDVGSKTHSRTGEVREEVMLQRNNEIECGCFRMTILGHAAKCCVAKKSWLDDIIIIFDQQYAVRICNGCFPISSCRQHAAEAQKRHKLEQIASFRA